MLSCILINPSITYFCNQNPPRYTFQLFGLRKNYVSVEEKGIFVCFSIFSRNFKIQKALKILVLILSLSNRLVLNLLQAKFQSLPINMNDWS